MAADLLLILAAAALAGLAILVAAGLAAWRGWLQLKHRQLGLGLGGGGDGGATGPAVRIEIADLKERVRRLEAIAAGVEL